MLMISISVAGCLADSQSNQQIEDSMQTQNAEDEIQTQNSDENANEPQDVRIVNSDPIKYENVRSYEVYWEWHNRTSDILREQLGEEVRVYSHSLSYVGRLEEVGKYYILLDDSSRGVIYVNIDCISAIEKEPNTGVLPASDNEINS